MNSKQKSRLENCLYWFSLALLLYMPLHVFLSQLLSLLTGGLEVWKATKDIVTFLTIPGVLYVAWYKKLFKVTFVRWILLATIVYALLHLLYVLFDQDDDTFSALLGSVYNLRILVYLALGAVVGASTTLRRRKILFTALVLISSLVALFGVMQYVLPHDLLENVGYSVERGVKPMFFIDDDPDLPRVMSTLRDPNSLGAYLILPLLVCGYAFLSNKRNREFFVRPLRREALAVMIGLHSVALFLTFSRGALLGLGLAIVTLLYVVNGERAGKWLKRYWYVPLALTFLLSFFVYQSRESAIVQDYLLHASDSADIDPNEKRVLLQGEAIAEIVDDFDGKGPGSAGLVSIRNPQGGVLTENYYLQIAYEVGWLGIFAYVAILSIIAYQLSNIARRQSALSSVLFASLIAYAFYSLLIHLWSNEAVALQWWLLSGLLLGATIKKEERNNDIKEHTNN